MKNNAILSMEICTNDKIYFHTKCHYKKENNAHLINFNLIDNSQDKLKIYIIVKTNKIYLLQPELIGIDIFHLESPFETSSVDLISNENIIQKPIDLPVKNSDITILNNFCEITEFDHGVAFKLQGNLKKTYLGSFDINVKVKNNLTLKEVHY